MPELPDLVYIAEKLHSILPGQKILRVEVKEPVVIRMLKPAGFQEALTGSVFEDVLRYGPFLKLGLEPPEDAFNHGALDMVVHFMLTGRFQLFTASSRKLKDICFSIYLDSGNCLNYADKKRMGKVYVTERESFDQIPGYSAQGIDVLSRDFTLEIFNKLIEKKRQQVRVFLMDQSSLSAIGNAYADEILFEAGIHPKTPCSRLDPEEIKRLYSSIGRVINWGIDEVEKAGQPIEVKVRDHLRVRNRRGEPCKKCGSTIRRVGVLGYDSFFCPRCQLFSGKSSIPWRRV